MKQISEHNNFLYLFFSLIVFLFSAAVVAEYPDGISEDIFSIVTIFMLLVSIKSLKTEKTWKWAVYAFLLSFVLLTTLGKFFDHRVYVFLILIILLLFFIGSFSAAAKQVLMVGDIDGNKIIGSLSLYLLLGLIWAVIYLLLLFMDPSAFSGVQATNWQQGFSRIAYYSFVTLTTLGYGDILPSNHIAEFFVYLEAIIGVFYMAIIVSSLISLRLSAIETEKKKK
ncbi:MAG: two pore domain potassium channel family protein [Epsilonproteobacteria bacterium]|nr:MAG: two pore domain potassium channel family protein [Campylobacterota bacterium]